MERLQEALAKARSQRQRDGSAGTQNAAPPTANQPALEAWAALTPLKLNQSILKRNRIAAAEIGHDAAPYDLLRTKIIHQSQINGWKRIAIVSPDEGAGKSTTLANLGFSFERQRDMRVGCFDLDLRRPALQKMLGQKPDHTMADVLNGRIRFADHGLRLGERVVFGLNNGPAPHPSELLLSRSARESLDEIEQEFAPDLTLFDLSPLNASDDNIAFLQNVDCAVIVVEAESTPMGRIDQAERQVAELTNVMGIVLNKCRYMSDAEGYDYY
jgi:Mrp family chromosome partitioning ATPase